MDSTEYLRFSTEIEPPCWLASLNGPELLKARSSFKQEQGSDLKGEDLRRCNLCFAAVKKDETSKHVCGGKIAMFENLTEALPEETRLQFALYTLKGAQVGGSGDSSFKVQSVGGGKPCSISLGNSKSSSTAYQLTHTDLQTIGTGAHLSDAQTLNVAANLRSVLGRTLVQPGLHTQLSALNRRFSQFFTCKRARFEKGETMVERPFFYCEDTVEYLKTVATLRGHAWDDITLLIQGDSGQQWFKLIVGLIHKKDLLEVQEGKRRRTRDDGVGGGAEFKSYGVRKIQVLALVQEVPETHFNLCVIFSAVGLERLRFKITGDLHFLMSQG